MSAVFDNIIAIGNAEDNLRKNPLTITNSLVKPISIDKLVYEPNDFGENIVLSGNKKREVISNDSFNKEFSKKTFDLLTYIHWDNVVVAGGSLVNIITNNSSKINDIDMFIYGLDTDSAKLKVDHVINSIRQKALDMKYDTRVYMNKNVINIYVFDTKKLLQVQIILRLYDTLAHILVGFDVDCCAIAYNGKEILTTDRGYYALKYRVNVANLKRRSPSYENRLIKYSFRGFDVVTNFNYKNVYNKMFFMASENYGFTRLLEQELINNGQLKNIIFNNTLRFRQTATYTSNYSSYGRENLEIKDVANTENSITKYNANIEDDTMKFREYNIKNIELMQKNVLEQFTGSFNPITDEDWLNGHNSEEKDNLGRSKAFINLKYNKYKNISEFENIDISDISNFDAKCLAVMYLENEADIVRIVENKYIPKKNNMYRIEPVKLAILLGRTKLAEKLMKGHSYETMKELIYMMDNDKLFTKYCNSIGASCTDVDKTLVSKFNCENISDNIHNQNKGNNVIDEFYNMPKLDMLIKLGVEPTQNFYYSLDFSKLPFEALKILYEKNIINSYTLAKYIIRTFKDEEVMEFHSIVLGIDEENINKFIINKFNNRENSKSKELDFNVRKLLKLKKAWTEHMNYASIYDEYNCINSINPNLYTCMINIKDTNLTLDKVIKFIGTGQAFDILIEFILFLDDVSLIQKLIPKDDLYVKLKYHYYINKDTSPKVYQFFEQIDKDRQTDKIKTNKIIKNTDYHINALMDGELPSDYVRTENVFGMTPDDNIIAKMLLLYNKVFNKKKPMNDKDIHTLKNMRNAIANINRNDVFNPIDNEYFYSIELHNLFFDQSVRNTNLTNDDIKPIEEETKETEIIQGLEPIPKVNSKKELIMESSDESDSSDDESD